MISPMLLKELTFSDEVFDTYKDWYWQEKHNGERALIHVVNGSVGTIRNRNNNIVKQNFVEVSGLKFSGISSAIIDCEMVVMDGNDRSVFYGGINQRRAVPTKDRLKNHPVKAVAFDIIYLDGKTLTSNPYSERLSILKDKFSGFIGNHFMIVENIDNPREYWKKIVGDNREGLVIKDPKAQYFPGLRVGSQLKLKYYKQDNVIVEALEKNPKGVKISGRTASGIAGEIQWSFSGCDNIKVGDSIPVEYLDVVNNKMVQPHKIKDHVIN